MYTIRGDKGAILLTVKGCGCPVGQAISNSATLTGKAPSGDDLTDDSVDGSDPDPDGDGDPTNNDGTTDSTLDQSGSIGLAKRVVSIDLSADGCTEVVYEFNIENYGNVNADSIQVVDDLAAAGFGNCGSFTVELTSDDFVVDPSYDGNGNNNLLLGADELQVHDKGAILLTVKGCGCPVGQAISNSATLTGKAPSGDDLTDDSVDGSDPDPDGETSQAQSDWRSV